MPDSKRERTGLFNKISQNTGVIAALPALLLCAMLFAMLILDIMIPSMSDLQYTVFPVMVRMISLVSIFCMAACFGDEFERDRVRFDLKDLFFAMFVICMLISTVMNGITHDALFSVAYRYVGVYDLLIYILVYMYCSGRCWREGIVRVFFAAYMLVSDLICTAFIFNVFTGSIAAFNGKLEPAAIFFHGNHYGYFLVMAAAVSAGCFIFCKDKISVMGGVSLLISLGALALNRSMGCIIAAGIMMFIMIIMSIAGKGEEKRRAVILAASILTVSAAAIAAVRPLREDVLQTAGEFMQIISGDNNIYAGNGRWGIWQYVAEYIADYPWWGYGCEGIAEIMKDYTLTTSPHNEPLTYAAFFGIPAALLYCAGVITSVIKGLKAGREYPEIRIAAFAALGYFLSSIFGLAVFYTAPFEFIFLGLASQSTNYSKFE